MNEDLEIINLPSGHYYTNSKRFQTHKKSIPCPSKIKVAKECEGRNGFPLKWHYYLAKKEEFEEGDVIMVENGKYYDRYYKNGCFHEIAPVYIDLLKEELL